MAEIVPTLADLAAQNCSLTEGEQLVYDLLKGLPEDRFLAFYEPPIGQGKQVRRPDFVLLDRRRGACVIEVKDWEIEEIVRADAHKVDLQFGGKPATEGNPLAKAERAAKKLLQEAQGRQLTMPTASMVIFPFITRAKFVGSGLDGAIARDCVLCDDELNPNGFGKRLDQQLKVIFKRQWTGAAQEFDKARQLLSREVVIRLRRGRDSPRVLARRVREGEEVCRRIAGRISRSGHWLVRGPAGSGKTSVLVWYCCMRLRLGASRRALFLCYNIALRSYLQRLLLENQLPVDGRRLRVAHFYELCAEVLGAPVDFERPDAEYYEDVVRRTRRVIASRGSKVEPFDTILVDEGQDFDAPMLEVVKNLLAPGGVLVLAEDPEQTLYRRSSSKRSWKRAGLDFRGRRLQLGRVFRCTRQIHAFARAFLDGGRSGAAETGPGPSQLELFPPDPAEGEVPRVWYVPTRKEVTERIARDIDRLRRKGDYPLSEIAVIYDDKRYGGGSEPFAYAGRQLGEELCNALKGQGIPAAWVSRDCRAKEEFDVSAQRVAVLSVHSAKGFDFNAVYFVPAGQGIAEDPIPETALRAAYVGITRARHRLVVVFAEANALTRRLSAAQKAVEQLPPLLSGTHAAESLPRVGGSSPAAPGGSGGTASSVHHLSGRRIAARHRRSSGNSMCLGSESINSRPT